MGLFLVKAYGLLEAVAWRCSIKKRVLNNFTGKHLCQSIFFDEAAGWRPETLLKRDFNTGLSLCIFQNTRWYFVLVVVVDIFWRFCCWWCCHMLFSQSCFSRKLFSHCRLPFFEMFVYVLLKFDWLIIFFLENPTRKLKIINFFFSHFQHSFSNFTIAHAQF